MYELYSPRRSPIHDLDARLKLIFTLAFLLFLNLLPQDAWVAFLLFLTISLSLALLSQLGIGFVLKRSLLALPFLMAALPLVITGPQPHLPLPLWQGARLAYSPAGLERFLAIALKSWVSVQLAVLLAATTRFPDLLRAFQQLKVPAVFIAVIGLMGRYLSVIRDETLSLMRGRSSRSASAPVARHSGGSLLWRARITGGMAGSLFLRSLERSERVYLAMLARGYHGELPVSETAPLPNRDRRLLILSTLLLAGLWLLGLLLR